MTDKKTARLAACRLKGHIMGYDGRCRQCFLDFWMKRQLAPEMRSEDAYDLQLEVLDAE